MKKKILIVEDDPDFRMVEKAMIEDMGYGVIEAADAKDGIDLATKEMPDLILMDIRLPYKKRGIGAARMLRGNEVTRGIPIIFVTGYAIGEYSNEIRHIPDCGYLTKPFARKDLEEKIREFIDRARS